MRTETIAAVETSFSAVSAKRTAQQARKDAHQRAWCSLLKRKSTKWDDAKKLDSQASNEILNAIIQEARECRFDRRVTLSALQWEQLEERQCSPCEFDDLESLSESAKQILTTQALKVAGTMPAELREECISLAIDLAIRLHRVPTRAEIHTERIDSMIRDLA